MRDLEKELVEELDGIAEDLNPTPETNNNNRETVKKKGGTKK